MSSSQNLILFVVMVLGHIHWRKSLLPALCFGDHMWNRAKKQCYPFIRQAFYLLSGSLVPKFMCWNLTNTVMEIRGKFGVLIRWVGWGGNPEWDYCLYKRDSRYFSCFFSHLKRHESEKMSQKSECFPGIMAGIFFYRWHQNVLFFPQ